MINFRLREFLDHLGGVDRLRLRASLAHPESHPSDEEIDDIQGILEPLSNQAVALGMIRTGERIEWMRGIFSRGARTTFGALSTELFELSQAITKDAESQVFCHYDHQRIRFLTEMPKDWHAAFQAFIIEDEVLAGVDCYALGHNTACVFHMARVGEIGLRAIGRERGVRHVKGKTVPIEWATWGQVFKAIEPTIEQLRKKPNGVQKTNALAFYERILSDLRAIQSLYRDQTMHLRDEYDDGETQSAMFRVRELMNTLASKLDENSIRAIPWTAWK